MRKRRRNRSTWFPILGFDTTLAEAAGLSTVDIRDMVVNVDGNPNIVIIPIIPDVDVPPEQSQAGGGGQVGTTLRDFVEGQSCTIDRIVGTIQAGYNTISTSGEVTQGILGVGIAVVPTADDGTGNPAVNANELDPLRADNSAQPWMWRRVWVLETPSSSFFQSRFPTNNASFSDMRSGPHIDTKGTRRVIRREERIFLIYSTQALVTGFTTAGSIRVAADLRVLGHMTRAKNRSQFK